MPQTEQKALVGRQQCSLTKRFLRDVALSLQGQQHTVSVPLGQSHQQKSHQQNHSANTVEPMGSGTTGGTDITGSRHNGKLPGASYRRLLLAVAAGEEA